jgi:hypothetical protein
MSLSLSLARKFGAVALLSALAATSAVAEDVAHFEVDFIFPRNGPYKTSDVFPIALAVQNLSAARTFATDGVIRWGIQPLRDGHTATGVWVDEGVFELTDIPETNEENKGISIFVSNSNVTSWIDRKFNDPQEQYMLQWHLTVYKMTERCDPIPYIHGALKFSIEAPWEAEKDSDEWDWPEAGKGVVPDVTDVSECPVRGYTAEIRPNSTVPGCPVVVDFDLDWKPNPCAVNLDENTKKGIASQASSFATASATPSPTEQADQPKESDNAAHGLGAPLGLALIAAWAVGGLEFAF